MNWPKKSPKWATILLAKRYWKTTCRGNAQTCAAKMKVLFVPDRRERYSPVWNLKKLI